jgi:hypothetical protein
MCNSLCRDFEKNLLPSSDPPVSVTAVENGLPIAQKSGYIILALPTGNTVISFQNPGSDALMRTLRDIFWIIPILQSPSWILWKKKGQ